MSISRSTESGGRPDAPGLIYFGRDCRLSLLPLQTLLARGHEVRAVVRPARPRLGSPPAPIAPARRGQPRTALPMVSASAAPSLESLTQQAGIQLYEVSDLRHPETLAALMSLGPELLVVSCFPWKLPTELLRLAPHGGLNLHPSLLPRHRGPDPLFWVYRHGDSHTGVTIHRLTERLDSGAIVAQTERPLPPGLPGDELETWCAEEGGRLLASAIPAIEPRATPCLPQDESRATYESWPEEDDLWISPDWQVERAYAFARGVIPLGYEPMISIEDRVYHIRRVLGYATGSEASGFSGPDDVSVAALPLRGGSLLAEIER